MALSLSALPISSLNGRLITFSACLRCQKSAFYSRQSCAVGFWTAALRLHRRHCYRLHLAKATESDCGVLQRNQRHGFQVTVTPAQSGRSLSCVAISVSCSGTMRQSFLPCSKVTPERLFDFLLCRLIIGINLDDIVISLFLSFSRMASASSV